MPSKKHLKKKIEKKSEHSIQRCKERYSIDLSDIEFRRINNSIRWLSKPWKKRYYNVELIKLVSNTRSIYKVFYNEVELIVVYSKQHGVIESILPSSCKEERYYNKYKEKECIKHELEN